MIADKIYRDIALEKGLPLNFVIKDYYLMRLLQYRHRLQTEIHLLRHIDITQMKTLYNH